jgi:hypothetical protein
MRSEIRSEVNKVELADKIKTIMATAWKWKPEFIISQFSMTMDARR